MELNTLKPAEGSTKNGKRIGRGQGSGRGGTSTKGHKGAQSRSGYSRKKGFEGGQMPLQRRIPKGGFKNINRKELESVNLDVLQRLAESQNLTVINHETMVNNHLVGKREFYKILGRGELSAKLEVHAHGFSETAKKAIEEKGGSVNLITIY
jgi:large subunit ribosomal protein L15